MEIKKYLKAIEKEKPNKILEKIYILFGMFFAFAKRGYLFFKNNYYRKKYNFDKSVRIGYETILSGKISIGKGTYVQRNCAIIGGEREPVKIGKFCAIAEGVNIRAETHGRGKGAIHQIIEKPVSIGDFVWIGANSLIREGIKIGDNVTIGANSVVTKDVPTNSIAGGVPARIIKKRKKEK